MGNIHNYYYNHLDLKLIDDGYWDFTLNSDEVCDYGISDDCLIAHYDFNNPNTFASQGIDYGETIYSLVSWNGASNTGYTLTNIGLTGIDNGLITFEKLSGDTGNEALLSALTGSTLVIPSGETRLRLDRVTGMTGNYIYPIDFVTEIEFPEVGDYAQLCGGFYQGFYKLEGYDYQVLPNRYSKSWTAEVWLKKDSDACSGYTGTTLNDDYPDNAGFFLYFGTRAENKFWNQFFGNNTGCTSGCTADSGCTGTVTTFCTVPKENEMSILDDNGFVIPLNPPAIEISEIDNQFLIYHRGCGNCGSRSCTGGCTGGKGGYGFKGKTACDFTGGTLTVTGFTKVITDERNKFLTFHRGEGKTESCWSCTGGKGTDGKKGLTACSFSGESSNLTELDVNADVVDNAIGFRIKGDGSIGYRRLVLTGSCSGDTYVSGATIEEEYSASGAVEDNQWTHVAIRFVANTTYDECQLKERGPRKGILYIYVNCRLKLVVRDFDEFIAKGLNEHKDKQLGVPYNISLGGGSQGLLESMTFDGQDPEDLGLLIEQNFAGTFIGGISQFKLYQCNLDYTKIMERCVDERYRNEDTCFLLQENDSFVLQQNCFRIIIEKDNNNLQQQDGFQLLQENGFGIDWF